VESGKQIAKFDGPRLLRAVVFAPNNGKLLVSGDEQATIRWWDLDKGKEIRQVDNQALAESLSLAFSPNGKTVACAGAWNHFGIGNLVLNLQGRLTIKGHEGYYALAWDVESGQQTHKFAGLHDNIKAVAFAPDGKTLAASSRDGRIVLWQADTGNELLHILAHPVAKTGTGPMGFVGGTFAATPALCFAPDGKTLYSAGPDRTIRQWDVATAKELGQFQAPDGGFTALVLTQDGTALVSASTDSTVLVWSPKAITNAHKLPAPPKGIAIGG
jgi:WD40 repeat protein